MWSGSSARVWAIRTSPHGSSSRIAQCRPTACVRQIGPDVGDGSAHEYCTMICSGIATELDGTQRIVEASGNTPAARALFLKLVEISDLWSECQQLSRDLWDAARSKGTTQREWGEIKRGPAA